MTRRCCVLYGGNCYRGGCWSVVRVRSALTTANATVEIPVQHLFRGKKLELFTPGSTLVDGTNIEITRLEYLISNVRVQKADGAWIDFPNQYFHINAEDEKEAISLAELMPQNLRLGCASSR